MKQYIESGVVEAYVLHILNPIERHRFEEMLALYPELRIELLQAEILLEPLHAGEPPPPAAKAYILHYINNHLQKNSRHAKAKHRRNAIALQHTGQVKLGKNARLVLIVLGAFVIVYFIITVILICLSYFK